MSKMALIKNHKVRLGLTYEQATREIDNLIETITHMLFNGETVTLSPIGTLTVLDTAPRKARNPKTGEPLDIPAGRRVKLNIFWGFKEKLKK